VPWSRVLSFDDPFPLQSTIQAADVQLFPTAKGSFDAALTQIGMNQLWMQRFYVSLPQVHVIAVKPGRKVISFFTSSNSAPLQHCGMEVVPGNIIVNHFDVLHQRSHGNFHFGAMSLGLDDFHTACQAIIGHDCSDAPRKYLVRPDPALMSRLLRLHGLVGDLARDTPDVLAMPEVQRALEQELIRVMIGCLAEGGSLKVTAGGHRHDLIVSRFEEFLEANPDRPLYLMEICAAIGVAERTLRIACQEHLGMGPIRYLTLRRMHLVRRALLRAHPAMATVTQIATDHGFWELGRFSVAYRSLFGEPPSASLRRPAEDPRMMFNRPPSYVSWSRHLDA
jgi:AraC-like DNA-binding protein